MEFSSPQLTVAFFSPTGNTKKICSRLAYALNWPVIEPIDFTQKENRDTPWRPLKEGVCIIGAPVYAGRIPRQMVEALQIAEGNGNWAIPLVVNGNVQTGESLHELGTLLRRRGFRMLAAASFVGIHSFAKPGFPLGTGRPDEADMRVIDTFAAKIRQKWTQGALELALPAVSPDYSLPFPQYRAQNMCDPPQRDEAICVECKECWAHCPVNAIDFFTLSVDGDTCIRCYACVRVCKWDARTFRLHLSAEMEARFKACMEIHREPEIFI